MNVAIVNLEFTAGPVRVNISSTREFVLLDALLLYVKVTCTTDWPNRISDLQGIHIIVSYICIVHTSFSYTRKFVM